MHDAVWRHKAEAHKTIVRGLAAVLLVAAMCASSCGAPRSPVVGLLQAVDVPPPALPETLVVSVVPFDDHTRLPELAWLRKGITDLLVAEMAKLPHVTVVQRDRLEEVFREQRLQVSGRVDERSAVRIGRLAGATVLVTGSAVTVGTLLRLEAQLVDVERGVVLATSSGEGPTTDPFVSTKALVQGVLNRLHRSSSRQSRDIPVGPSYRDASQANDSGETLSRSGKLFQALEEYERALTLAPGHRQAQSNFSATVGALSGRDLVRELHQEDQKDRRRVATRLVERLVGSGLSADIRPGKAVEESDGTMTVTFPVRLGLNPDTADTIGEMVTRMGGAVNRKTMDLPRLILDFTLIPSVGREVTRQLAVPRRVYLRVVTGSGHTIAVSSPVKSWLIAHWVGPMDDVHAVLETGTTLETAVPVSGLTSDQVSAIERAELVVEPAPRERVTVRVEYDDQDSGRPDRRANVYRPGTPQDSENRNKPELAIPTSGAGDELRKIIEAEWNPVIVERGWGAKTLPSNVRTAVTTIRIEENGDVVHLPRLARASGDSWFDERVVDTVRGAVRRWVDARRSDGPVAGVARFADRPGRVRIQFQSVTDLPPLNVITLQAAGVPVTVERSQVLQSESDKSPQ